MSTAATVGSCRMRAYASRPATTSESLLHHREHSSLARDFVHILLVGAVYACYCAQCCGSSSLLSVIAPLRAEQDWGQTGGVWERQNTREGILLL